MIIQVCDVCGRVVGKAEKFCAMPIEGELVDMCPECVKQRTTQIKKAQLEVAKRVLGWSEEKWNSMQKR